MKRTFLIAALLALQTLPLIAEQTATDTQPPGYKEIPYYLRKLEETTLEDERVCR